MLGMVLVVVTIGHLDAAGRPDAPHVSFSATADAAACAEKSASVSAMLAGAGYQVAAVRCIQTAQRFSAYRHAGDGTMRAFRVALPADAAQGGMVQPLDDLAACSPAPDADPAVWCALSSQSLVEP